MANAESRARKTPEEWLEASEREAREGAVHGGDVRQGDVHGGEVRAGRLKVFLGYAPGVGKTFSMLSEGIRRRSRGEDVVIGVVETHGRNGTAELACKLEQVPRREMEYKGTFFSEMDVEAVLARSPQVAIVDELAHTNVEGSRSRKRYEDVLLLLQNGIDVISTLNIQHVESLAPRVHALTGVEVREQVPDWMLDRADEVVLSDLTPEALVTRMRRGDIYPPERVERSLQNFFRRGNLIALREMALQRVTRAVDRTLDEYVQRKRLGPQWTVSEKVAVCISANLQARDLIARGARLAEALGAELYILHVASKRDAEERRKRVLEASLQLGKNLGAQVVLLEGRNTAQATATFLREYRVTQAIVGRSATHGLRSYFYYFALQRLMAEAPHVDLHIVTQEAR